MYISGWVDGCHIRKYHLTLPLFNKNPIYKTALFDDHKARLIILSTVHGSYFNTLLEYDVTRRDPLSVVMDAGSRIVNFLVNFIRDGTVFA